LAGKNVPEKASFVWSGTQNLDSVNLCPGSYVVNAEASPMLRNVAMNASQQTPSSDAVLDDSSAETIYDTWLLRSPSDFDSYLPRSSLAK